MKEFFLDAKALGTWVRSNELKGKNGTDSALVERLRTDELRWKELVELQKDANQKNVQLDRSIIDEMVKLNAQRQQDEKLYKRVWKPFERIQRNELGKQVVSEFGVMAERFVSQLEQGSEARRKLMVFWAEKQFSKAITLRENRLTAQRTTMFAMYGMAVLAFIKSTWPERQLRSRS